MKNQVNPAPLLEFNCAEITECCISKREVNVLKYHLLGSYITFVTAHQRETEYLYYIPFNQYGGSMIPYIEPNTQSEYC